VGVVSDAQITLDALDVPILLDQRSWMMNTMSSPSCG